MVGSSYGCGGIAACAVVAAATLVLRAQQPRGANYHADAVAWTALTWRTTVRAAADAGDLGERSQSISANRLKNPSDSDWPMIRRTYDGWGYSPLRPIDTDNVKRLQPAWIFSTGAENGREARSGRRQRRHEHGQATESLA